MIPSLSVQSITSMRCWRPIRSCAVRWRALPRNGKLLPLAEWFAYCLFISVTISLFFSEYIYIVLYCRFFLFYMVSVNSGYIFVKSLMISMDIGQPDCTHFSTNTFPPIEISGPSHLMRICFD
jgi:hypothetical protein